MQYSSRDHTWQTKYSSVFIDKVRDIIEDKDLPALYFYLSLIFSGIVNSKIDNFTYTAKKLQMWRLSPETRFSFEFAECLSSKEVANKFFHNKYVCGRVLPVRLPVVKFLEAEENEA